MPDVRQQRHTPQDVVFWGRWGDVPYGWTDSPGRHAGSAWPHLSRLLK